MDVEFVGQPWHTGSNLDDFLNLMSQRPSPKVLRIAVAWAKRSGLSRVKPYLDLWRNNAGTVQLVVGISEGGATKQGLELALHLADEIFLFHDPSGRTLHPKVYLGQSDAGVDLLVGSHNLSAGGVYFNYEAGVTVNVPAADLKTEPLVQQIEDWFDLLLGDPDCCLRLDATNLAALVANPAYRIGDEDNRRSAAKSEAGAPEEIDSITGTEDTEPTPLFTKSSSTKKSARHNPRRASSSGGGRSSSTSAAAKQAPVPIQPVPKPPVQAPRALAWSRKMDHTAAQQKKSANTSLTHNLRLAAARHPIDIKTYWRKSFFDTASWQQDPIKSNEEFALVDFDVFIYGVPFGTKTFRIDHNLNRVSGQGNVPTLIKWGPMEDYLRANNHVGDWVLLERRTDGTYALRIESQDPGTTP